MGEAPLQVIISKDAESDLIELADYWDSAGEPERGDKYVTDLMREAGKLRDRSLAFAGNHPKDVEDPNVREIRVFQRVYRIIYRANDVLSRIEVLRFWHSHRDKPEL